MLKDVAYEKSNQKFITYGDYSVSDESFDSDITEELFNGQTNNGFFVDEPIAEAISILNKKGYATSYSCAGHLPLHKCDTILLSKESKSHLSKYPQILLYRTYQYGYTKVNEDDEAVYYSSSCNCSPPYIAFEKGSFLDDIPEGFTVENNDKFLIIKGNILFFIINSFFIF